MKRNPALFLVALALSAGPLHAAEKTPGVEFLSPSPGGAIHVEKVILIGRFASGKEKAQLLLNGKPVKGAELRGRAFSAALEAIPGENAVEAREGGTLLGSLKFRLGTPVEGAPRYAYHQPLQDGECNVCHTQWKLPATPLVRARTCLKCHEGWKNTFPHGPVAAGECLFCHDPHGSPLPSLARHGTKVMCVECHSQSSSKGHLESSKNQNCTACHDPHGGNKKFFLKK